MLEMDWPDLVTKVRKRLNDRRGHWGEVAYALARAEGAETHAIYRWLREFSRASFGKVDGGRLQRLAHTLDIPIIYSVPLDHRNGRRGLTRNRGGAHD